MIKRILPILFILVIWFIFSKPFFLDNKAPFPSDLQVNHFALWGEYSKFFSPIRNPAIPDVISQLMPWKHLVIDSWKNGQIPLWNPYSLSGTLLLANYQSGVFSITNIFYFLFDFVNAWSIGIVIQPLLAGVFMYIFIRSLKLGWQNALMASLSFMFCGFVTTWMSYGTLSLAIAFLPLALFSIEKYSQTKSQFFLILLSLTFPLSFFSGHFQSSLYFAFFVFAYTIIKFWENRNKIYLLNFILFSFLGLLLSSPQILPSIELYFLAPRSSYFSKIDAVSWKQLATIISPDFYGNPVTRNNFFGNYVEWSIFLGVIPFLMGIFATFQRSKKTIFFLFMGIISLLFCFDTPILDTLIGLKIPVISTSSVSRILVLFSFSFAVLSAFGLKLLIENLNQKLYKNILIWLFISILIFIVLWGSVLFKNIDPQFYSVSLKNLILPSAMFLGLIFAVIISVVRKKFIPISVMLLILFTAFDMLRFATKWQPFQIKEYVFPQTPIISELTSFGNIDRIYGPFGAEGSVYFQIPSTEGYDPLYINRYGEFLGTLANGRLTPSYRAGATLPTNATYIPKVIDFMGIKYVLLKKRDIGKVWAFPFKRYPKNKFKMVYKEKGYFIYENQNAFPRTFLVGDYKVINSDQEIMSEILLKDFDLKNSVILEKNINFTKANNLRGNAKFIKYSPNKIDIQTNSNSDSLLVLTDNYYPGWTAKVNGREVEVLRADYTFRAVQIPKGNNKVEFYFDPKSFRWGVYLALISAISIAIILLGKLYTINIWNRKQKTVKTATKLSAKIASGRRTQKKRTKSNKAN